VDRLRSRASRLRSRVDRRDRGVDSHRPREDRLFLAGPML
jgi:hypothetical protein